MKWSLTPAWSAHFLLFANITGNMDMRHITIHLKDDQFDNMPADEVPAFLFELIRHRLWQLTDPRTHISEIAVAVPPEPLTAVPKAA